ncbi:putative disease resistance protein RGA3 isoform X2 [Sorghum bicolor]|uniref:NB-ARC domain-containing protein n=1 Tax=Sorghum bicolor TaxID=4558 RepID=C5X7W3_SORBI|nr:putative disease resistance protein RGA3 isoform X2 [Sorghum bicolor]EER95768.1 hypothetical protein SORBI_3002G011800 [Sorghum bicolor]|eukprot:XP_002459247.1 putative disease resistance protein RGA3 isoform X2 [Sorghum bicolor]
MDTIISVVLGEVITRSIKFFISKSSKPKVSDVEDRLQRVLLRAQVIIDEATGRHITNQAMLQQLGMLRDAMYQGNYLFDISRYQSQDVEDTKDPVVSYSLSLCSVSSRRGISPSNRKTELLEQLQHAVDNLSSMILDVKELVGFLMSYPRLYRQPYSVHLLLSNCMFGRQMESHLVISFLLNTEPHGSEELEVLPIFGPCHVGKSTLVSHVCKDERVRDHFSEILLLSGHDFTNYDLLTLRKRCAVEHQKNVLNTNKDRRLLVVELDGDVHEDAWNKLFSSYKQWVPRHSKIIVTSRSGEVIKFGTTPPLHLKYLSHEAYWYFFKTLTFGCMDPKMQPRFAHVAMEIARLLSGSFICANYTASLLRNNFDIHFWCKVLTFLRQFIHENSSKFGRHPYDLISQNKPVRFWRMAIPSEDVVPYAPYQRSSHEEVPDITIQDVLYGNSKLHGKFEVLSWRSQIPPYYSYVLSCEIRKKKTAGTKRKRSKN